MTLLAAIFVLVFTTELISWIGKSVLLEFVYAMYLRIFYFSAVARQRKLKSEILLNKKELLQTSAQDQFAKWAKLRRSVDKGLADLEKLNDEISSSKSSFSLRFNSALWLLTTGLQFIVGWWYRKSAVFYLPPGWFGPVTWWLSFPFAPAGSVSCGMWQMACRRVIKVGERVVQDLIADSAAAPSEGKEQSRKVS
ncbi:GET complex subunit get1 [Taiwanofungus camphoratus]|nr:GET complex subunit get1 [Antrodia cinnamomea]KAI0930077.1 GET complex subunit get1 [Antrodia cinnamomea]